MMKECRKCHISKSFDKFSKSSRNRDGYQSWCKKCSNKARMETYFKNPSIGRKQHKLRVQRNRDFIKYYLSTHPCVDCGFANYLALQFDHVRGKKVLEITRMMSFGYSLNTIKEEIDKCEVRCANCHQIKNHRYIAS